VEAQGRTFLVTGGGSGLGAATARELAGAGGSIVLADVDTEHGEEVARELGGTARFVETDVTDEAAVAAALDAAAGELHGVVNCAGIGWAERVVGREGPHDLERFARVIQVNLIGTFNVIRLAAARMTQNEPTGSGERGVIVNTASVAAFDGQIGQVAYSASKAGVHGITLPIARELGRFGIRVCTIAPGIFDTPMMARASDEVRESLHAQVPWPPRFGQPEEYAALVRHIVENEMLNGETIRLDGGIRMAPK
jgi:NAD(P)-dependent dehydrogenase (short-subunit alcohol dehydrogenase family)